MTAFPTELFQMGPTELGVSWSDGHKSKFTVRRLRLECPCASCVDEWTREKRLKEESVPQDIRPVRLETVGRYAINFSWTDGHSTGFYTFDQLRALCECDQCRHR